jgi:hypothetical protein
MMASILHVFKRSPDSLLELKAIILQADASQTDEVTRKMSSFICWALQASFLFGINQRKLFQVAIDAKSIYMSSLIFQG